MYLCNHIQQIIKYNALLTTHGLLCHFSLLATHLVKVFNHLLNFHLCVRILCPYKFSWLLIHHLKWNVTLISGKIYLKTGFHFSDSKCFFNSLVIYIAYGFQNKLIQFLRFTYINTLYSKDAMYPCI